MNAVFKSRETQGKLEADQRRELSARITAERDSAAREGSAYTRANAGYMNDQQQAQQQIRREQDVVLDKMGSGLDTLKEMAVAIDTELQEQGKMIDDIDKEVDEAQVRGAAADAACCRRRRCLSHSLTLCLLPSLRADQDGFRHQGH